MEININDPQYTKKTKVVTALYRVIDPELMINIMDMGLVYNVDFLPNSTIVITMTLSTPHCPLEEAITSGIRNSMDIDFPGISVQVNIVWEPSWNYTMLTAEGREQLGFGE